MSHVLSDPILVPVSRRTASRGANIAAWVLQALVAFAFLGAGLSKLAAAPAMVAVFDTIGVGQWFRLLTGVLEVVGAIGVLVPRTSFYAAALLATVMVGAVVAHLAILGGSPAPPIVLLAMCGTIAYLRRP